MLRRNFLISTAQSAAGLLSAVPVISHAASKAHLIAAPPGSQMRLGLVTYLWARDWDLPTLIRNCEKSKVLGVELRTTHKHGVEPRLNAAERKEVKKRFELNAQSS